VVRHRATAVLDWRQGQAAQHQQARQRVPAQDPDPRCTSSGAAIKPDGVSIGAWLEGLDARAHKNVVIVAMANKLARIARAVLSSGNEYRPAAVPA